MLLQKRTCSISLTNGKTNGIMCGEGKRLHYRGAFDYGIIFKIKLFHKQSHYLIARPHIILFSNYVISYNNYRLTLVNPFQGRISQKAAIERCQITKCDPLLQIEKGIEKEIQFLLAELYGIKRCLHWRLAMLSCLVAQCKCSKTNHLATKEDGNWSWNWFNFLVKSLSKRNRRIDLVGFVWKLMIMRR